MATDHGWEAFAHGWPTDSWRITITRHINFIICSSLACPLSLAAMFTSAGNCLFLIGCSLRTIRQFLLFSKCMIRGFVDPRITCLWRHGIHALSADARSVQNLPVYKRPDCIVLFRALLIGLLATLVWPSPCSLLENIFWNVRFWDIFLGYLKTALLD